VNLATLKSLGAAAVAILGMFDIPSAPATVRFGQILAGGLTVMAFVHKTATPVIPLASHAVVVQRPAA